MSQSAMSQTAVSQTAVSQPASKLSIAHSLLPTSPLPSLPLPSAKTLGRPRDPEVLTLAASLLADLPRPPTLSLHVPGVPGVVYVDTGAGAAAVAGDAERRAFGAAEWRALVLGVEADRVWPADLQRFARRMESEPHWRLSAEEALAGAQPDRSRRWTLGELLERVGAQLVAVEIGDGPSERGPRVH